LIEVLHRFPTLPRWSIDKGVMEHMTSLAVFRRDGLSADIGSW
jgi:mannose-1-phosphate guanylyltransferase